jgi:hypothetical protein
MTELPEYPHDTRQGISRAITYNDPMMGLIDAHIRNYDFAPHYRKCTEMLSGIGHDLGIFASSFDMIRKLSSLLENKCDFGVRLKSAYDSGDREKLARICDECDVIIEKISALRWSHRKEWMEHNKPFGWEIHDIRYGGLIARFDTVKARISDYLAGEINEIEELQAERIPYKGDELSLDFTWAGYTVVSTPNNI